MSAGERPTDGPDTELPATLGTVEDVAAVCEAAGLASGGVDVATGRINAWGVAPSRAAVQVDVDENGDLVDAIVFRFGHDYPIATVHRDGDPSPSLLLAAIRAAQGGT